MESFWLRMLWFIVASGVAAYGISLVLGGFVNAQAAGLNDPIPVRDDIAPNKHELSGMVMVPTPCDELSVKTREISVTTYGLDFTTWREPSVTCSDDPTPRSFQTIVFAPAAGVYFVATLNGTALPIGVIPLVDSQQ